MSLNSVLADAKTKQITVNKPLVPPRPKNIKCDIVDDRIKAYRHSNIQSCSHLNSFSPPPYTVVVDDKEKKSFNRQSSSESDFDVSTDLKYVSRRTQSNEDVISLTGSDSLTSNSTVVVGRSHFFGGSQTQLTKTCDDIALSKTNTGFNKHYSLSETVLADDKISKETLSLDVKCSKQSNTEFLTSHLKDSPSTPDIKVFEIRKSPEVYDVNTKKALFQSYISIKENQHHSNTQRPINNYNRMSSSYLNGIDKYSAESEVASFQTEKIKDLKQIITLYESTAMPYTKLQLANGDDMKHNSNETPQIFWPSDSSDSSRNSVFTDRVAVSQEATHHINKLDIEKSVYNVAVEIATSERQYVELIRLLNVDLRKYLISNDYEDDNIPKSKLDFIFNCLEEIQILNEHLLDEFETRIANWSNKPKIADILVKSGQFLKCYAIYIREYTEKIDIISEGRKKYPKFSRRLADFQNLPKCKNLAIEHFFLKPIQRLPQYKLLLETYLKKLTPEHEDFSDAKKAIDTIELAVGHVEHVMANAENFAKMRIIAARMSNMSVIEPSRCFIKEGELLKISRSSIEPRYIFLFNDCLVYAAYSSIISIRETSHDLNATHILSLSNLEVNLPPSSLVQELPYDFNIISSKRSFSLRAKNSEQRDQWVSAIESAIDSFKLRIGSKNESIKSPVVSVLCEVAPVWVPDKRVSMCQLCATEFGLVFRRHHCRACGSVVCKPCSKNKAPIKYLEWQSERVCDTCFKVLSEELGGEESLRKKFKQHPGAKNSKRRSVNSLSAEDGGTPTHIGLYTTTLRRGNSKQKVTIHDDSDMCGHLYFFRSNKWRIMFFSLKGHVVYVYKAMEDSVAKEIMPVLGYKLDRPSPENNTFPPFDDSIDLGLIFRLRHKGCEPIILKSDKASLTEKWIEAFQKAINLN